MIKLEPYGYVFLWTLKVLSSALTDEHNKNKKYALNIKMNGVF